MTAQYWTIKCLHSVCSLVHQALPECFMPHARRSAHRYTRASYIRAIRVHEIIIQKYNIPFNIAPKRLTLCTVTKIKRHKRDTQKYTHTYTCVAAPRKQGLTPTARGVSGTTAAAFSLRAKTFKAALRHLTLQLHGCRSCSINKHAKTTPSGPLKAPLAPPTPSHNPCIIYATDATCCKYPSRGDRACERNRLSNPVGSSTLSLPEMRWRSQWHPTAGHDSCISSM